MLGHNRPSSPSRLQSTQSTPDRNDPLPGDFLFGVAISDHQCEAYDPDRPDIRDHWAIECHLPIRVERFLDRQLLGLDDSAVGQGDENEKGAAIYRQIIQRRGGRRPRFSGERDGNPVREDLVEQWC